MLKTFWSLLTQKAIPRPLAGWVQFKDQHRTLTEGKTGVKYDDRKEALRRCSIYLYTAATFLFKAVNFAMRTPDLAKGFMHLKPYAHLLSDAVRHYAREQPWHGTAHRVLPVSNMESVRHYERYSEFRGNDPNRLFSWMGFVSATALDYKHGPLLFQDLRKYGRMKECLVFIIEPDADGHNRSVYPVDLGNMAAFGTEDRELLYPAGQQFRKAS